MAGFTDILPYDLFAATLTHVHFSVAPKNLVEIKGSITLKEGVNCRWDGEHLLLVDEHDMPTERFSGIEYANSCFCVSGFHEHSMHKNDHIWTGLYPYKALGNDFEIWVASHIDYIDATSIKGLRILEMRGFPKDRIRIFVNGSTEEKTCEVRGLTQYHYKQVLGKTLPLYALGRGILPKTKYILLIHDTVNFGSKFLEKVSQVDIGLGYDIVEMGQGLGIMLLRTETLCSIIPVGATALDGFDFTEKTLFERLFYRTKVVTRIGEWKDKGEFDVYGTGCSRRQYFNEEMDLYKFASATLLNCTPGANKIKVPRQRKL